MNFVPYRGCKKSDITQYYSEAHKAIDLCPNVKDDPYGKWLVAPANIKINFIDEGAVLDESENGLNRGYGLYMQSMEEPDLYWVYWHTLPVFPVSIGEYVNGGEEVAQMGNSGACFAGGVPVPDSEKLKLPFKGTHLHLERFRLVNGKIVYEDPLPYIDFNKQPSGDFIKEMWIVIKKIMGLLK